MGFSYRKSVKMGPFRVTASKSGISYSAGVKGVRVTKRANGKVQTTLSAPSTGLRHTTSTSSSRSRQPSWHATGHTMTPDGREVDFRCHHNHRTESAAVECAGTVRKQIQRGQGQHLITRVRSTSASREADRQRALQKEADHQAKAASQRAEALQRRERKEQATPRRAEEWSHLHGRNDERAERVNRRRPKRSQQRRPRGWPVTGLIVASGAVVLGAIIAGLAGNNSHSAPATTAGALITLGILALLICGSAALWRRLRRRKRDQPHEAIADGPKTPAPWQPPPSTPPPGYNAGPYPSHTAAGYLPDSTPPTSTGSAPPWET